MTRQRSEYDVRAALAMASDDCYAREDRAQMLLDIATALLQAPKTREQLEEAVRLCDHALELWREADPLFAARVAIRKAMALQAMPDEGSEFLERARDILMEAIPVLREGGSPEECAEAEMNYGLVLQSLSDVGRARLTDAIAAYQRALRVFDKNHPREFAILQNNLATAFLSIPLRDGRAGIGEALAVQAYEAGVSAVTLIDHPREYAMLQNNLGNALQYASSSHAVENNVRALAAYDEALKVRTRRDTPLEYANTIANKGNCLMNLPDDHGYPERGNRRNLATARDLYAEAAEIFSLHGERERSAIAMEALAQIEAEL